MPKIRSGAELADMRTRLTQPAENPEKTTVNVSLGTCGIASGALDTLSAMRETVTELGLPNVEFAQSGCMCCCFAEPTVEVTLPGKDPVVFGHVDAARAKQIVESYMTGGDLTEGVIPADYEKPGAGTRTPGAGADGSAARQYRIVTRNCGFIDPESIEESIAARGYEALAKALTDMTPEAVVGEIKKAGLRGRGGGGFPTGLKWELAAAAEAHQKYVVCNADEGDPGAFMDRAVLEGDPHSVVEAMTICGYAVGATVGTVYIRAEYPLAIKRLQKAIDDAREYGLLGEDILGSGLSFDIELKYGAGAFVCGEETALIHSMEGKRGEPTTRPPYPAESGYWGKPTTLNNVETFANVPAILLNGADWFSSIGTEKSKGTKVFALAGKVKNVGLIEVPMGTTLREIIFGIGGGIVGDKQFKAVQTGGPSGGALTIDDLDTQIDYDNLIAKGSMMGSGGMIVMDEDDCMVSVAKFFLDFTLDESCGKCTPCRVGSQRLYEMLERITNGVGTWEDLGRLKSLSLAIKDTALCGLGQSMPNPILSTMRVFEDEYRAHVENHKCPAGVCPGLFQYAILDKQCVGCGACARICPVHCITGEMREAHVIDQSACIKCGSCFERCTFNAIVKE